jgi:hypothetical protein
VSAGTGGSNQDHNSTVGRNIAAGSGICGCLLLLPAMAGLVVVVFVFGGLGILLRPLIILILFFGGGGGTPASQQDTANDSVSALQGDGKGELDTSTLPKDLVEPIQEAGKLCDAIGPIVIASQVEKESGFNAHLVGPDGKRGLSQLPPDIFEQYGEDDDDNGNVSALDAEDSIMAQGRYMCYLADQGQNMIDNGQVQTSDNENGAAATNVLNIALAGYHVGLDAVRTAKGVPKTNDVLGYIIAIRVEFAKYQGIAAPPADASPEATGSASPKPTGTTSPEASGAASPRPPV